MSLAGDSEWLLQVSFHSPPHLLLRLCCFCYLMWWIHTWHMWLSLNECPEFILLCWLSLWQSLGHIYHFADDCLQNALDISPVRLPLLRGGHSKPGYRAWPFEPPWNSLNQLGGRHRYKGPLGMLNYQIRRHGIQRNCRGLDNGRFFSLWYCV